MIIISVNYQAQMIFLCAIIGLILKNSQENWILAEAELDQLLEGWTDRLVTFLQTRDNPAIFGIRTRGVPLGERVKSAYDREEQSDIPLGLLDITLYRDDLSSSGTQPIVKGTECMFDVDNREILLVDDVLFTGRTIRAALDELFDFGRPAEVRLAVLVDRGHRELPIEPDLTGRELDVKPGKMVRLRLNRVDDEHGILIEDKS